MLHGTRGAGGGGDGGDGGCEERNKRAPRRHMWKGPLSRSSDSVLADVSSSPSSTSNFFFKDGRKISVGDCALFKPPQDSPPFIGIIRWLKTGKENKPKVGVNWLYRPAEVKLGKGILLEAAPNEIFYSFHEDEIPAASLLHPCKVSFLPKGVELPSGICSFVCRRVYDITNKCLWWLTDQDYIDERQEEVDKLLCKTRIEMHATVQPGGRSPKPMNSPSSTSQLKPGSDGVQNSTPFPSQIKGKKRERGDHGSDSVKRERTVKMEDGENHYRQESFWRSEISKFTEKGGLVDSEGVEKLVQLMLPEKKEKKIDLVGRSILAGVIAATDKFDCLNRFVQLRGMPVFDEWLQEVHKGKIGDGSATKDGEKAIEEFLLVLLRALDKLPVNLSALQMCNIGKSVNNLRTHKNLEIQKKARSLVDAWKKRVGPEIDAKSGLSQAVTWPSKPRLPEVSLGGNRHSGLSSEVAMKSSAGQFSSSKAAPVKVVHGDGTIKSASVSPGSTKSAPSPTSVGNNLKEGLPSQSQPRISGASGASDPPLTVARDEKSSSSSQSHNNSQSCSSDQAKNVGLSGKEDARSSTAGSIAGNKVGASSRHRKSVNGFSGPSLSGAQRETGSSRSSSAHRNPGSEKISQSSLTSEKMVDVPVTEGSSHKLIVKIPNRGRSPAQSASGGSFEDPSVMNSRASSPVVSDKHDLLDRNLREKNDTYRGNTTQDVNTESWQSNDFKEVLTGSDEGDGSPATLPDEEHCRIGDGTKKLAEVSKAACSSSVIEQKLGKLNDASFSSINALIESCVKYSEPNASSTIGDDVGMNLLASVATGEISKSDGGSPTDSPQRNPSAVEQTCLASDSRVKSSLGDGLACDRSQSVDGDDVECEKHGVIANASLAKVECKSISSPQEDSMGELNGHSNSSMKEQAAETCQEIKIKSEEIIMGDSLARSSAGLGDKVSNGGAKELSVETADGRLNVDALSDTKEKLCSPRMNEEKVITVEHKAIEGSSFRSIETAGLSKKTVNEELNDSTLVESKPPALLHSEFSKGIGGETLHPSGSAKDTVTEDIDDMKVEKADETDGRNLSSEKTKNEQESNAVSAVTDLKAEYTAEAPEINLVNESHSGGPSQKMSPPPVKAQEQEVKPRGSKMIGEAEECTSAAAGGPDVEAKVEFDLNEGFNADDVKYGESNNLKPPGCSTAAQLLSSLSLPVPSVSNSLPASITVAAPAKGPFVPPEDLLKSRGELGWKGTAATSAFRPAEPRKVFETPVATTSIPVPDSTSAKPSRPFLDIDLNVPDERVYEDLPSKSSAQGTGSGSDLTNNCDDSNGSTHVRSCGGLDFDLNRVDEPTDSGIPSTSNNHRLGVQLQPGKLPSAVHHNGEMSIRRDFDLNDGPLADEVGGDQPVFNHQNRNNMPSQTSVSGLRINSADIGNFASCFPQGNQGNPYSAVTIQSMLPDRGEQPFPVVPAGGPQRMMTPPAGSAPFNPDVYRTPVLSSSPAVPFPSTPFQYPVFPFGTNFSLPTATFSGGSTTYVDSSSGGRICFPAVHSQVLAPAGAVPSYQRPYVVSMADSSNNVGAESSRKYARQGLDLNAGPLGMDVEGRDEAPALASRQLSIANLPDITEEHLRIYQLGGGVLKRKEPEGGWEGYKQSTWQ